MVPVSKKYSSCKGRNIENIFCTTYTIFEIVMNATDLFEACRINDLDTVKDLYEQDASIIHTTDARGFTPLILAVYNDAPEIVRFLIEKGADLNAQDASGNTALMGVCFKGYKNIAQQLIAAGATINQRNGNGATALTFAATFGHLQIAEWLLQNGADLNVPDTRGKTPVDHAYIQENEAMMELFQRYSPQP